MCRLKASLCPASVPPFPNPGARPKKPFSLQCLAQPSPARPPPPSALWAPGIFSRQHHRCDSPLSTLLSQTPVLVPKEPGRPLVCPVAQESYHSDLVKNRADGHALPTSCRSRDKAQIIPDHALASCPQLCSDSGLCSLFLGICSTLIQLSDSNSLLTSLFPGLSSGFSFTASSGKSPKVLKSSVPRFITLVHS